MEDVIRRFLATVCHHGSGSGSGYGYGSGSGYGDGSGDGDGSGYGYGHGSGDGSGYGSGYGHGHGHGDGSGYGDCYGYGEGYVKEYNGLRVYIIDGVPTLLRLISLDDEAGMSGFAVGRIVKGDLTTEKTYVAKRGGLFAHGTTLEKAIAAVNDKLITTKDVDKRIEAFMEAFPLVDTFVKGTELFRWHNLLTGSCLQGRRGFVEAKNLDLEAEFTILEFIALTKNVFGGNVIKELEERYRSLGGG